MNASRVHPQVHEAMYRQPLRSSQPAAAGREPEESLLSFSHAGAVTGSGPDLVCTGCSKGAGPAFLRSGLTPTCAPKRDNAADDSGRCQNSQAMRVRPGGTFGFQGVSTCGVNPAAPCEIRVFSSLSVVSVAHCRCATSQQSRFPITVIPCDDDLRPLGGPRAIATKLQEGEASAV